MINSQLFRYPAKRNPLFYLLLQPSGLLQMAANLRFVTIKTESQKGLAIRTRIAIGLLLLNGMSAPSTSTAAEYAKEIDSYSCVYWGSGVCRTVKDPWEVVCDEYHSRAADQRGATHYVLTSIEPAFNILFIGPRSEVKADYYQCGNEDAPVSGSAQYQDALASKRHALLSERLAQGRGSWDVKTDVDVMTDQVEITLKLNAIDEDNNLGGSHSLIIHCDAINVSLTVDWGTFINSGPQPVLERVGKNNPVKSTWGVSHDFEKTIHPNAKSAVSDMVYADTYAVRTQPIGENQITLMFDVRGLAGAMGSNAITCGVD